MPLPYGAFTSADKQLVIGDPRHEVIRQYMATAGGVKEMAAGVNTYLITPPATRTFILDTARITIVDNVAAFDSSDFGGIAALTNGCLFEIRRNEGASPVVVVRDLLDAVTLKTNTDLARLGRITATLGTNSSLVIELDFRNENAPMRLDSKRNESLVFQVRDSLATLLSMTIFVTGRSFQKTYL